MNELLKKLFEAEILTDETKKQIEEAVAAQTAALIEETKAATEEQVRAELAEQWLETRDNLIEAIDLKVTEMVAEEFTQLEGDIAAFRDLEVEYASKLSEAKTEMVSSYKKDLSDLVENLDTFLDLKISEEFTQLEEDLKVAKQNDLGLRAYQFFEKEFTAKFVNESEVHQQLEQVKTELTAVTAKLSEATATRAKMERSLKLEGVLSALNGGQRELMETILSGVRTEDLDKAYAKYISRVLKESHQPTEKEAPVLAEGVVEDKTGVVKTGDLVTESDKTNDAPKSTLAESDKLRLQRLAGIL